MLRGVLAIVLATGQIEINNALAHSRLKQNMAGGFEKDFSELSHMTQTHRLLKFVLGLALVIATGARLSVNANSTPQLLTGILAKMEKAHKDLKSLKAQIVQEKTNVQIGSKDKDSGTLLYKPASGAIKGKFRLDYTKPANNTVAVVGDNVLFYQPKINQAFKNTLAKAAKGRVGGYALLIGLDRSAKGLLENYNIEYIKDEVVDGQPASHLRLTPKVNGSLVSIELWVNNQTWIPTMQKFNERNGDYTVVKLTNLQQNVALNDNEFEVKLPAGTKVVDKF